jgi:hypothetical protein
VVGGLGRDGREKAIDKKQIRNPDTRRKVQKTASTHFRYREIGGLKSEVQCLNDRSDELLKRLLLILSDFWVKNST